MASISQIVPNYVQGASNQPDQLKVPGQVRDLVNAYPDVTRGCMKRLGSQYISNLGTSPEGEWFAVERGRNPAQQFIGKWDFSEYSGEPQLQMWDLNGVPQEVWYSDTPYDDDRVPSVLTKTPQNKSYLTPGRNPEYNERSDRDSYPKWRPLRVFQGDGKIFTLNDTIVPNFTTDSVKDEEQYFEAFVSLRQVQYQRDYLLAFDDPMKNDDGQNIDWTYAKDITKVKWPLGDPNKRDVFDENDVGEVCDLQMGYQKFVINGADVGKGGKIRLEETDNYRGEDLQISVEVVCQSLQEVDRNDKKPEKTKYYWKPEYTPRIQLLNGGRYWKAGDRIVISYEPDQEPGKSWKKYTSDGRVYLSFIIGDTSTSTIMADIGYITVKTDMQSQDETVPFASGNDIIAGLCHALEQAGAKPLKYAPDGTEVVGENMYPDVPATVSVFWGGSGYDNVTEDVGGPDNDHSRFLASMNLEFKPIGNGIYMRRKNTQALNETFKLVTPEEQLFNHFTTKKEGEWYGMVSNVSRLPPQCRDGIVVKIANSSTEDDDYYLKFIGNDDIDGEGVWEETHKPGYRVLINPETMPHEIIQLTKGHWVVTPIYWEPRTVGDEGTAPPPSFIDFLPKKIDKDEPVLKQGGPEGVRKDFKKTITGMAWYRNRFILFSDKSICCSVAGDYYNFFPKTAMTQNETDPVDITAAGDFPTPIVESMEMTAGLVLFSKEEQFLFTTDADMLKPTSAKVMSVAQFNYNVTVPPIKIGQNIGFLSDAGLNDKLFEMSQVSREGSEPKVIELSKLIEPRLPDNVNLMTHTKSNMTVFLGKYWTPEYLSDPKNTTLEDCDGKDEDPWRLYNSPKFREVWGYKYYDNGNKRVQSAWFRWVFDWPIAYHVCMDDNYYVVLHNGYNTQLRKIGLKHEESVMPLGLDGGITGCPTGCFYQQQDKSYVMIDSDFARPGECYYFELYNKNSVIDAYKCGEQYEPIKSGYGIVQQGEGDDCNSFWVELDGNWFTDCNGNPIECGDPNNQYRIAFGKNFSMVVDFPTIYVTKTQGDQTKSQWDPNLTIHRCKFSVGKPGTYKVRIRRKSRDTVEQWHDVNFDYPRLTEETFTQPVFMKNVDIDMRLVVDDPHGGILYSMQWEGDYNPKWYKNV